ncbi:MAG: sigma-70 family RNA polymerase sigma factor [Hydrococcus sp. Prado102]|jgi:hypothetical protein|nr:sigma-70 family RNA polymerase sigma factor [Hydrococcus sp. Prado102]
MAPLQQQLEQLITEACNYPLGSRERQKNLTKIIRLINSQLWRENTPYYEDALQQTWIYFCQNLCEGKTGQPYDRTKASVVTWLNNYLKRRLQDFYITDKKRQNQTISLEINSSPINREQLKPADKIQANSTSQILLEEIKKWVQTDPQKKLSKIHLKDRPDITCQVLILRRLPPETAWKVLAIEFGVSIGTLSSFYQRQCLPILREFGEMEGYL